MTNLFIYFILFNYNICNYSKIFLKNIDSTDTNKAHIYSSFNSTKNINSKKNLIFGIIHKYSLKKILPFFNSLLEANINNCDKVMFVRNVSETLISYLKRIGVFVYKISDEYKDVSAINIRWKMYIDFLSEKKNEYNLVISIDIRDSIFQRDFFSCYEGLKQFLGVAIEDGTLNEKVNRKWIIDFVGEEKHKVIQNERIICIGTIWGTSDIFLEFSKIFWKNLIKNTNSIEQGIVNYLFYYEKIFNDCLIRSDNSGPVMTIALTDRKNISLDSRDNILNFKGEVAAIVHQYDRKFDILNKIKNKFLYSNKTIKKHIKKQKYMNLSINMKYINKINKAVPISINFKNNKNIISFLFFFQLFAIILLLKMI